MEPQDPTGIHKRDAPADASPFFPCLADAFGFNYGDGNFRFPSMCGKNDFAPSQRSRSGPCRRVPQCLTPCFLPGRAPGLHLELGSHSLE